MTIEIKILFNARQLYSIPQFLRTNFEEVNYKGEQKEICDSSMTFPAGYYLEK